jgi:hypothetical protein
MSCYYVGWEIAKIVYDANKSIIRRIGVVKGCFIIPVVVEIVQRMDRKVRAQIGAIVV